MADQTSNLRVAVQVTGLEELNRLSNTFAQLRTESVVRPTAVRARASTQTQERQAQTFGEQAGEAFGRNIVGPTLKAPFAIVQSAAGLASRTVVSLAGPLAKLGVVSVAGAATLGAAVVAVVAVAIPLFNLAATMRILRTSFGWAKEAADRQMTVLARTKKTFPGLTGEALREAEAKTGVKLRVATALFGEGAEALAEQVTRKFTEVRMGRGLRGERDIFYRWGITPQAVQTFEAARGGERIDLTDYLALFIRKREELDARQARTTEGSAEWRNIVRLRMQLADDSLKLFNQKFSTIILTWSTYDIGRLRQNFQKAAALGAAGAGVDADQQARDFNIQLATTQTIFKQLRKGIAGDTQPALTQMMDTLRDWLTDTEEGGKGMGRAFRDLASALAVHSWQVIQNLVEGIDPNEVNAFIKEIQDNWNPQETVTKLGEAVPALLTMAEIIATLTKVLFGAWGPEWLRRRVKGEGYFGRGRGAPGAAAGGAATFAERFGATYGGGGGGAGTGYLGGGGAGGGSAGGGETYQPPALTPQQVSAQRAIAAAPGGRAPDYGTAEYRQWQQTPEFREWAQQTPEYQRWEKQAQMPAGGRGLGPARFIRRGPGPPPMPQAPPPPQPSAGTGATRVGGGRQPTANYFQGIGARPLERSQAATIQTPFGKVAAHPQAASDAEGFFADLGAGGAPIGKLGSYNKRQKRWGGGWSSHAYAAAWDIDDQVQLSPAMRSWIKANPDKWNAALDKWNMSQPLPAKDPAHIEWRGPKPVSKEAHEKAQAEAATRPGMPVTTPGPGAPGATLPGAAPQAPSGSGGLSREKFEAKYKNSKLAGSYDDVVAAAKKHGIPADIAASIMAVESGWGKSRHIVQGNNPGGITTGRAKGNREHRVYGSLAEGIDDAVRVMAKNYKAAGGGTAAFTWERFNEIYAPYQRGRAANDPNNTNKNWRFNILKIMPGLQGGGQGTPTTPQEQQQQEIATAGLGPGGTTAPVVPPTTEPPPAARTLTPRGQLDVSKTAFATIGGERARHGAEGSWSKLTPELRTRLTAMANDMPEDIKNEVAITSGWRSSQLQAQIYRTARPGFAARPGGSQHEKGAAVDLAHAMGKGEFGKTRAYQWMMANKEKYGLTHLGQRDLPGKWEPWHWEVKGARQGRPAPMAPGVGLAKEAPEPITVTAEQDAAEAAKERVGVLRTRQQRLAAQAGAEAPVTPEGEVGRPEAMKVLRSTFAGDEARKKKDADEATDLLKRREEKKKTLAEKPPQKKDAMEEGKAAGEAAAKSFKEGIKDTKIPIKSLKKEETEREKTSEEEEKKEAA